MGVPTMYSYLLSAYDKMGAEEQAAARRAAARLRLTVSGSAACPLPVMQRWEELSGACPPSRGRPRDPGCGLLDLPVRAACRRTGLQAVPRSSRLRQASGGKETPYKMRRFVVRPSLRARSASQRCAGLATSAVPRTCRRAVTGAVRHD